MILDATASYRTMWTNPKDPDTVFMDERQCVKPDIVCVWQNLPFKKGVFSAVNWDPPHMLYESKGKPMAFNFKEKYGLLQPETWQSDFRHAWLEFMRVLKPESCLLMKWNNNHITDKRLLAVFPIQPKFTCVRITSSRGVRRPGTTEPRSITSFYYWMKPLEVSD
jgi:hypothetical protein